MSRTSVTKGTGTTTLEANLLHHLTDMREAFLPIILLDIQKVYNALEQDRCLDILKGYGVGPWTFRIFQKY